MDKHPKSAVERVRNAGAERTDGPGDEFVTAGRSGRPGSLTYKLSELGRKPVRVLAAAGPVVAEPAATKPAVDSRQGRHGELVGIVVDSFLGHLIGEAERKGGPLSIDDLEALGAGFEMNADDLRPVFEKSYEDYVRDRQRAAWDQARNYPFNRLMVEKFSHLFDEDHLLESDDSVSRRILPGFLIAINMMLGPEEYEEYQERCRRIVKRIKSYRGDDFDWSEVHFDEEAKVVTLDTQVAIAFHFDDLEKRADWLIELINNNLAPLASGRNPDEAVWRFTEGAFRRFLGALLRELKETLSTEGGRMRISRRHGVDACVALADIIKRVESFTG